MAVSYMLAFPYGYTRIMSSYNWDQNWVNGQDQNDWVGPPHDSSFNTVSPSFNADGSCGNGWICEHRWRQIYNMVEFRNVAHGECVLFLVIRGRGSGGGNCYCCGCGGFVIIIIIMVICVVD